MEKDFWKSWTFWGSVLLGASMVFDSLAIQYPWAGTLAKAIAAFLIPFGIRRAIK